MYLPVIHIALRAPLRDATVLLEDMVTHSSEQLHSYMKRSGEQRNADWACVQAVLCQWLLCSPVS